MNKLNIQKFAETTSTLGLSKPAITDKYDIEVFNNNMDIIDTQITFAQPRTTLWTGDLPGGSSITLEGVKRFLEIYMKIDFEAAQGVMRYVIDTTIGEVNSGAGVLTPFDEDGVTSMYISESNYNNSTKVFTHRRTGYFGLASGEYSDRNNKSNGYTIYRIDTYN